MAVSRILLAILAVGVLWPLGPRIALSQARANPFPFLTPIRAPDGELADISDQEMLSRLGPCIAHGRRTFGSVLQRFGNGSLDGDLVATAHAVDPFRQFHVIVDVVSHGKILGRMETKTEIGGREYAVGQRYELNVTDVVDWAIFRVGRPEEGNLLGRYIVRASDGVIDGGCDPSSEELNQFRIYQPGYSFIPPASDEWFLQPGTGVDVSLQRAANDIDQLDTVFSVRVKLRQRISRLDDSGFADYVVESERRQIDRDRSVILKHDVKRFTEMPERCFLSTETVEDSQALNQATGERELMIRDFLGLVCLHPQDPRTSIILTYVHRHATGQKRTEFETDAMRVLRSLSFSQLDVL